MDGGAYARALEEARKVLVAGVPEVMSRSAGVTFEPGEAPGTGTFIVDYLGGLLEVTYPGGEVRRLDGGTAGSATVAEMVIVLHYLARAAGPLDLTDPIGFQRLPDASAYTGAFRSHAEVPVAQRFGEDGAGFVRAVKALGGVPAGSGEEHPEVLWSLPFLPHLPVGVRLGLAEDAMPPECVMLFPRRAGYLHHVEDLAVAGELVSSRLLEAADEETAAEAALANGSDDELVVLAAVYDPMEAEIIAGRLRSAGIEAVVRHNTLSVVYGLTVDGCGKTELLVRAGDLPEAQAALDPELGV